MRNAIAIVTASAFFIFIAFGFCSQETKPSSEGLRWMTMTEALAQAQKDVKAGKKPKKLLIDAYTSWCGWCKHMDKVTFEDARVIKVVNEYYYPVKFDAEGEGDITYKGKVYKAKHSGRTHELAITLLKGQMSYPNIIYLDEAHELIQNVPGFRQPDEMIMISSYFGTDGHKTTAWDAYQKSFKQPK